MSKISLLFEHIPIPCLAHTILSYSIGGPWDLKAQCPYFSLVELFAQYLNPCPSFDAWILLWRKKCHLDAVPQDKRDLAFFTLKQLAENPRALSVYERRKVNMLAFACVGSTLQHLERRNHYHRLWVHEERLNCSVFLPSLFSEHANAALPAWNRILSFVEEAHYLEYFCDCPGSLEFLEAKQDRRFSLKRCLCYREVRGPLPQVIQKIEFALADPDFMKRQSVCTVPRATLRSRKLPSLNTIDDCSLGPMDGSSCSFDQIELPNPLKCAIG